MLQSYLDRLNAKIDAHNKEVDEAVATFEITEDEAKGLRFTEKVTHAMVYKDVWPQTLLNIVGNMLGEESRAEIIALGKSVKKPTTITRDLCKGAAGAKPPREGFEPAPILQLVLQVAHLRARAQEGSGPPSPAPVPE